MSLTGPHPYSLIVLGIVTALLIARLINPTRFPTPSYIKYLWALLLIIHVSEWLSFTAAAWMLAFFSFLALREYFSLIDIRLQDRWGILGAYLSIPFMTYLVQIHWYGMFIISIPVYTFLVIPLLVALGGHRTKGAVFSIGAIDFGLFLFVYCAGHIAYLTLFSTWMAVFLVVGVAICDIVGRLRFFKDNTLGSFAGRYVVSAPCVVAVAIAMSGWMTLPVWHCVSLGLLLPFLVVAGNFAISAIEYDLNISEDHLLPGTGQIIHGARSFLFSAPVVFHYIRYFWEEPIFR